MSEEYATEKSPAAIGLRAVDLDAESLVSIGHLLAADSPRLDGEDLGHIRVLAESGVPLPPILVQRQSMQVIDGMHRLQAAKLRGQEKIAVRYFDGSNEDAFIEAVRANTTHGLPLTFADRQAGAIRILKSAPTRSDRWIGEITGLAPGTIGVIRRSLGGDTEPTQRIGRDGRIRPIDSAEGRQLAGKLIDEHPELSVRDIARRAGISPATASDVKKRMLRGEEPVRRDRRGRNSRQSADKRASAESKASESGRPRNVVLLIEELAKDPSVRFSEPGRSLVRWLGTCASGPKEWEKRIRGVSPHSLYIVARVARKCADEWAEFARVLEERLRTME